VAEGVGLGVGGRLGGAVKKPESVGATEGPGDSGVGSGGKDTNGGELGVGPGVGVVCTKMGCDRRGVGVGVTTATPPPLGRANATSIAPIIRPMTASTSAARIGSRLPPDAATRRLGYVTPAASPATGRRW